MNDTLAVLGYYLYYKYRKPFGDRNQLAAYQKKKLKKQMRFVVGHSRFYHGKSSWNSLPPMDKNTMMEHFNELNTVGIDRDRAMEFALKAERSREFSPRLRGVTVGLSSGTSGSRGIFLVSNQERQRWAGYVLAHFLPGSILKPHTIAFFMRADSNLYQTVESKKIQFHFFDIYRDMEEHKERLETLNPEILIGQPSLLLALAEERNCGRLKLHPAVVISVAEVLEQEDENRLRQAFHLPVIHQIYQCTEGCLGSTCACGTLHLHEDIVRFEREYLDERRFVPIVTDMERKAQPIIRYRMNDILVEKKTPCACGNPCLAIEKIEGREDDIFLFTDTKGQPVRVFPDFLRRCILFAGELPDYRIVQETDESIVIYAGLTDGQKERVLAEFKRLAADRDFSLPTISFLPYQAERGRKLKRVERVRNQQGK